MKGLTLLSVLLLWNCFLLGVHVALPAAAKPLRKVPEKEVEFIPAKALFHAMTGRKNARRPQADAVEVIGAGFCRTGTSSLHTALLMLDISCYKMGEVIPSGHGELLSAAFAAHDPKHPLDNKYVDMWMEDLIFQGFKATVDVPSMRLYKHMMRRFPDAKVILTTRSFESWYTSVTQLQNMLISLKGVPFAWMVLDKFERVLDGTVARLDSELSLQGCFEPMHDSNPSTRVTFWKPWYMPWVKMPNHLVINKTACYNVFTSHNTEVMDYVPKEKLLVFGTKDGWAPLANHLGYEIPTFPFPKANTSTELGNIERMARIISIIYPVFFLAIGFVMLTLFRTASGVIGSIFPDTLKAANNQVAQFIDHYVAKFNQSPIGIKMAMYRSRPGEVYNYVLQDSDLNEILSMIKVRFEDMLHTFKAMATDAKSGLELVANEFKANLKVMG